MKFAYGHLRLAPRDFWAMGFVEFEAAIVGYRDSVGAEEAPEPMTRADLEELERLYKKQVKGKKKDDRNPS